MSLNLWFSDTRYRTPGSSNPATRSSTSVSGKFVYHFFTLISNPFPIIQPFYVLGLNLFLFWYTIYRSDSITSADSMQSFFAPRYCFCIASSMSLPISEGLRVTLTPAASSAAIFSSAVPLPPEIMAPACPIRLPFGAVTPAM